jgi:hypothetical protein
MSTDQHTADQQPTGKCQEVTWKGKPCASKARFIIDRSQHAVCLRHLNAFPPGITFTPIKPGDNPY